MRRLIISQTGSLVAGGSLDLGQFGVAAYPRISGWVKVDSVNNNTANVQFRSGLVRDTTLVTSLSQVGSGGSDFSYLNSFPNVGIGITPVQSATNYSIVVFGEPIR